MGAFVNISSVRPHLQSTAARITTSPLQRARPGEGECDVDTDQVLALLREFRDQAAAAVELQRRIRRNESWYDTAEWKTTTMQLEQRVVAVGRVVAAIDPTLADDMKPDYGMYSTVWSDPLTAVTRAIGVVEMKDEIDAMLRPQGPVLSAGGLHAWVWQSAAKLWDDGHLRQAVQAAAGRIEQETKAKADRFDVTSATTLMNEAWSSNDPLPGQRRLRPAGFTPGTADYTSAIDGTRFFAAGCMQRIRNLTSHGQTSEPDAQVATEMLAALSLLARWTHDAEIATGQ
jgi:Protein of unknown function (Hypoth_ymh)